LGNIIIFNHLLKLFHNFFLKKSCLIYDTNKRATIEQLLEDPYFHYDHWADSFEVKLKQVLDYEREQNDKIRKKKLKKVIQKINDIILIIRKIIITIYNF